MGNVKQCRQCGQLFQSFGAGVCPKCAEETEKCFIIVKDYIYDHPDANLMEISKETGIEEKMVLRFLREGRLSVSAEEGVLECEKCGAPISSGRFCGACQGKLESMLNRAYKPKPSKKEEPRRPSGARMHIDYRKK